MSDAAPSAYTQYKTDNAKIASWLGRAALNHGYPRSKLTVVEDDNGAQDAEADAEVQREIKAARNARKKANRRAVKAQTKLEEAHRAAEAVMAADEDHGHGEARAAESGLRDKVTGGVQDELGGPAGVQGDKAADKAKQKIAIIIQGEGGKQAKENGKQKTTKSSGMDPLKTNTSPAITPVMQRQPSYCILSVDQYVELARYIVTKSIQVPSELFRLLNRCIVLRDRAATQYGGADSVADRGHAHIIAVLRQIRDLLAPHQVVVSMPRQSDDTISSDSTAFVNRFGSLGSEDIIHDEELYDEIEIPSPSSASGRQSQDSFAIRASSTEALLHAIDFFFTFQGICRRIRRLWTDYTAGRINLITAGVSTNAYLSVFQASMYDYFMREAFPVFKRPDHATQVDTFKLIAHNIMLNLTLAELKIPAGEFKPTEPLPYVSAARRRSMYEFIEMLAVVFSTLQKQRSGEEVGPIMMKMEREAMDDQQVGKTTRKLLDMMSDMLDLGEGAKLKLPRQARGKRWKRASLDSECEVLASLMQDWSTGRLSVFTVLGFRVLTDIMEVVEGHEEHIMQDVRRSFSKMIDSYDRFLACYSSRFRASYGGDENMSLLEFRNDELKHHLCLMDSISLAKDPNTGTDSAEDNIFGRHPILLATISLRHRIRFLRSGLDLCDTGRALASITTYYSLLAHHAKTENEPLTAWHDIDYLSTQHRLPVIRPPGDILDIEKSFRDWFTASGHPKDLISGMLRLLAHVKSRASSSKNYAPRELGQEDIVNVYGLVHTFLASTEKEGIPYDKLFMDIHEEYRRRTTIPSSKLPARVYLAPVGECVNKNQSPINMGKVIEILTDSLETDTDALYFDYVSLYGRIEPLLSHLQTTVVELGGSMVLKESRPADALDVYNQRVCQAMCEVFMLAPKYSAQQSRGRRRQEPACRDWVQAQTQGMRKVIEEVSREGLRDMRDSQRALRPESRPAAWNPEGFKPRFARSG